MGQASARAHCRVGHAGARMGGAWAVARFSGLKGLLPDIIVNEVFEASSSYNSMKF